MSFAAGNTAILQQQRIEIEGRFGTVIFYYPYPGPAGHRQYYFFSGFVHTFYLRKLVARN